jgi:peptidoglycan hydrolase CwlO-like protein
MLVQVQSGKRKSERTEKNVVRVPPSIPMTVSVIMSTDAPQPTVAALERAKERAESSLYARQRELNKARAEVLSLERQVSNVQRSIDDLSERIEARSAAERVEFLEEKVKGLEREVAELRNPRDGREFS